MTPTNPPAEPSPFYDNGPYPGPAEARAQFAALAHGIPVDDTAGLSAIAAMTIAQALLGTGVATTDYETGHRDAIGRQLDPETAVVVAGWIRRAWLAGAGPTPPAAARAQP